MAAVCGSRSRWWRRWAVKPFLPPGLYSPYRPGRYAWYKRCNLWYAVRAVPLLWALTASTVLHMWQCACCRYRRWRVHSTVHAVSPRTKNLYRMNRPTQAGGPAVSTASSFTISWPETQDFAYHKYRKFADLEFKFCTYRFGTISLQNTVQIYGSDLSVAAYPLLAMLCTPVTFSASS